MSETIGTAPVAVQMDSTQTIRTLRIIAKHAEACAAELEEAAGR